METRFEGKSRALSCSPQQRLSLALSLIATFLSLAADAGELSNGFVYLRDIDPSIAQDMRYATSNNFVGHVVPGYDAPECVLVKQAAEALKAVQEELHGKDLSLKVYDCYRPARAVAAFASWSKLPDEPTAKAAYYPNLEKNSLFPRYIAMRSSHSRGATVDLTLVPLNASADAPSPPRDTIAPCTAPRDQHAPDDSLDMGTSFDCFDAKAHTRISGLTEEQRKNRGLLVDVMNRHGFRNYENEWWHFTLHQEPYPDTIFDFPIAPRNQGNNSEKLGRPRTANPTSGLSDG